MASVTKRNGSYRIRVSTLVNGKKKLKSLTWRPEAGLSKKEEKLELNKVVSEFERTVNKGKFLHSTTFAEFTEVWMEDYAEKELRPRTIERYKSLIKRINSSIGHVRILEIEPHHIRFFIDSLSGFGVREDIKYKAVINIKKYIKDNGMLIKDVAKNSQISESTMNQVTRMQFVDHKSAHAICDTLNLDIMDAFEPSEILKKPLAGKTLLHYYRLISLILKTAIYWEVIKENPADQVRAPRVKRRKAKYLNEEEVGIFISCLASEDILFRTIILTYLYSGCRRAELLALTWDDVNLQKSTITINKTILYMPDRGLFMDETKTEESNRTISIPKQLVSILYKYKEWQDSTIKKIDKTWGHMDFVFSNGNGTPIRPDRMTYTFSKFIKRVDLPNISLHSLRHTSATLQIMGGVPIRAVADRLGHVKTSTTLDIYSHALKSGNEYGAEVLSNMIDSSPIDRV